MDAKETLWEKLIKEHQDFCRVHRGLKEITLKSYQWHFKQFQTFLEKREINELADLTIALIDEFICEMGKKCSHSLRNLNSTLRSFLRYLYFYQYIPSDLAGRLYPQSSFSASSRPKYVPWKKIQDFLSRLKRESLKDKRDYAILMFLASYGMRGREVAALRVSDIDFINHRFTIRERKGGKPATFPLQKDVADALRDYLSVRPNASHPEIFLKLKPPFKPIGVFISYIVWECLNNYWEGRQPPIRGAYLFRHSFAKAMLDRGAPLTKIGDVLGHQKMDSTLIYTRIATKELREVADNYSKLLAASFIGPSAPFKIKPQAKSPYGHQDVPKGQRSRPRSASGQSPKRSEVG